MIQTMRPIAWPFILMPGLAITAHAGEVKVDGQVWEARSYDGSVEISAGESVEVLGLDGITLLVYPANRPLGR